MNKIRFFFLDILFLSIISCVKEDREEYIFLKPCLEWGSPKSQIRSEMADCEILLDEENTLCFRTEDQTIAYGFKNDMLHSVVVIPKVTLSLEDILLAFKGYKLLSDYENRVYLREKTNTIAEIEDRNGFYTISWSQYGLEMATAVDLGLSVRWSDVSLNMGYDDRAALNPENYKTKWSTGLIGWGDPTGVNRNNSGPDVSSISGTVYDVAKANWGGKWRLPTKSEFEELINACIWTWEERNGTTSGYKVTGPSGESIFLPTTGYRINDNLFNSFIGYYWTGTLQSTNRIYPYVLNFDDNNFGLNVNVDGYLAYPTKKYGCAVRPVQDY